jgi:hypothetical protein
MLKSFQQVPLGSFLAVREVLEDTMLLEQASDLVEAVLQPRIGTDAGHGKGFLPTSL